MVFSKAAIQFISVIYALFAILGALLVAYTAYTARMRIDDTVLRARAFLSESFMRDSWMLLFLACFFFLIHAVVELNEVFGLFAEESISDFVKEATELGIIVCIVASAYKWFKLMNPAEHPKQASGQESRLKKT